MTTIYPVQDHNALQDRRVMSLIQYAKKVEKSMFEVARSRVSAYMSHCHQVIDNIDLKGFIIPAH